MGDHRATVKIEFTFHGKTYKMNSWINYYPDSDGLDSRVRKFFDDAYLDGITRWHEELYEANREAREREIEQSERAELERLRAKYSAKYGL